MIYKEIVHERVVLHKCSPSIHSCGFFSPHKSLEIAQSAAYIILRRNAMCVRRPNITAAQYYLLFGCFRESRKKLSHKQWRGLRVYWSRLKLPLSRFEPNTINSTPAQAYIPLSLVVFVSHELSGA